MTLCLTAVNQSGYRDFYAQSDTFTLMDNSPTVSHGHFYHYIFINQWNGVMIVKRQSDIVNTKENILPVCDRPYHTKKRKVQKKHLLQYVQCN